MVVVHARLVQTRLQSQISCGKQQAPSRFQATAGWCRLLMHASRSCRPVAPTQPEGSEYVDIKRGRRGTAAARTWCISYRIHKGGPQNGARKLAEPVGGCAQQGDLLRDEESQGDCIIAQPMHMHQCHCQHCRCKQHRSHIIMHKARAQMCKAEC